MLMPAIDRYMTKQPWTLSGDATMADARRLMTAQHIRHIPIMDRGKLVGIVTDRDLRWAETMPDPDALSLEDVMIRDVFTVLIDAPADTVVEAMAARKCGSAVVVDRNGDVAGIFTANDALQFFAELLRRVAA